MYKYQHDNYEFVRTEVKKRNRGDNVKVVAMNIVFRNEV